MSIGATFGKRIAAKRQNFTEPKPGGRNVRFRKAISVEAVRRLSAARSMSSTEVSAITVSDLSADFSQSQTPCRHPRTPD
jgi:hypothetical protein